MPNKTKGFSVRQDGEDRRRLLVLTHTNPSRYDSDAPSFQSYSNDGLREQITTFHRRADAVAVRDAMNDMLAAWPESDGEAADTA